MRERDKFLTEAMGVCWHRIPGYAATLSSRNIFICTTCGSSISRESNNNFSSWEGFGKLWEWANSQGWWDYFTFKQQVRKLAFGYNVGVVPIDLINPDAFANAVYKFIKERQANAQTP